MRYVIFGISRKIPNPEFITIFSILIYFLGFNGNNVLLMATLLVNEERRISTPTIEAPEPIDIKL